jgi:hypothetical protein
MRELKFETLAPAMVAATVKKPQSEDELRMLALT